MNVRGPAESEGFAAARELSANLEANPILEMPSSSLTAVLWAGFASTWNRILRGEGVLIAVNFSLVLAAGIARPEALPEIIVSVATLGLMYAFNDLYDAPVDSNNPKKDRALISAYLDNRLACGLTIFVAKLVTVALASATLSTTATLAVAGAMMINVIYSAALKGVPVVDVAWCGLWGAFYAGIVSDSAVAIIVVGLMTAICHLYQALDDRASDEANAIHTTAVRSLALSRNVLACLCAGLVLSLSGSFGWTWALSAMLPLVIFLVVPDARVGWLATKAYFAPMWLFFLGLLRASS